MKRGEIYYIRCTRGAIGSEVDKNRPGIIVSNDLGNTTSPVVEVVYLTSKAKRPMETHARITSTGRVSIALCEQISSVCVDRIGDYLCTLTEDEMERVEQCMRVSLSLDNQERARGTIKFERDMYKKLYEDLLGKVTR